MNDVNNAHKVKRGVVCILASLGIGMVIFGALGGAAYVFAIPPLSPYDPNETLDPTCAPGDTNCTVVTPVAGTGALGQIGFFSGTSTIASDSKFTFSSSTGDLGLVSDSAQFKLGALSDVGITRSVAGTLKITDGSTGLGSIHIGGITFGTASGLLKATAGVVSTATTSDADFILPAQTGNSGKYLTTNGATSSWAVVPSSQWTTSGSDIYYNSGNVGIGTIAPSSKLHVLGGARIEGDANNTTLAGYFSSSTINIYNGNTTNSNYASIGFSSYFERVGVMNTNRYPAAGMGAQFLSHVSASSFNFPTDLYFWTGYSPIGDAFGTPSSEKMRITAAGNVGIGTSTPRGLLEVASSTSKTTLFTVLPNGNVGIGTTTPTRKLEVAGDWTGAAYYTPQLSLVGGTDSLKALNIGIDTTNNIGRIQAARTGSVYYNLALQPYGGNVLIGTSTASGVFVVATSTATSPLLAVLNNGNVGISTSNPLRKLHISDAGVDNSARVYIEATPGNNGPALEMAFDSAAVRRTLIRAEEEATLGTGLSFWTRNNSGTFAEKVRVGRDGNVGIGTSTPRGLLEVASSTSKTTLFTVLPNGNVGIGTTTADGLLTLSAATTTTITDLLINPSAKNAGNLIDAQVGGVSKFSVSNTGVLTTAAAIVSGILYNYNIGGGGNTTLNLQNGSMVNGSTTAVSAAGGTFSQTSGSNVAFRINPTYNQSSGTAANTDFLINRTETAVGSGAQYLIDAQVGGVSKFNVSNLGVARLDRSLNLATTIDISGYAGWINMGNGNKIAWSSTSAYGGALDTGLSRYNAGTLAVGNGTASDYSGSLLTGRISIATTTTSTAILTIGAATTTTLTDLLINPAAKNAGNLIDAQVGGVSKFSVSNTGTFTAVNGYMSGPLTTITNSTLLLGSQSNSDANRFVVRMAYGTNSQTSGTNGAVKINPIYNQTSGTSANTDLLIDRTETAVGSGAQYLIDAQVGSVSKFNVTNLGRGYFADGISIATSSAAYGIIVGDGSTQKDVYIPKGGLCVDDDNAGCSTTPTAGTIYAKATAITGIDIAEHYPTDDTSLEPGDVVSFSAQNSTFIEKATASSTQYLAGVISTEPGVLLGKNIENARPVALNGRVPVKVSNENGAINIGDYLTVSSQPGVAAKATSPGMTIGMALEAYNQSGVGKITVFVHTGFALGSSEAASDGEGGLITLLTRTFASIGITIENGITSIKQLIVDKITTKELCVEDLCLNKEQLKFILDRNGITIGSPIPTQESLPPAQTPPATSSSTEEVIPTETPAETPIETPVPTQAPPEPTASDTPPSPEPSASPSEQTQLPTETAISETPS